MARGFLDALNRTPLRFLLADRIDLLRETNLVAVYGDDIFVTVVIEEKQIRVLDDLDS